MSPLLNDIDIVCISETWMVSTPHSCSPHNFDLISSPAVRSAKRGRASGGLLIALKSSIYKHNIIKITEQCIYVKIVSSKTKFILGIVYVKPDFNFDHFCLKFNEIVTSINNKYSDFPLIVGGDFNARIGKLNQLNENIMPENSNIYFVRSNTDKTINK